MKVIDKSKITITILSIVFVLSLSVTITLAAFSANKTGDVTLTFADGLTMSLAPVGVNGRVQITAVGVDAVSVSYPDQPNRTYDPMWDGIVATLNKPAWVAFQLVLQETTSGTPTTPSGNWANSNGYVTFTPTQTGENIDWAARIALESSTFNIVTTPTTVTCTAKTIWSGDALSTMVFSHLWIGGKASAHYVNSLAGRSFVFNLTIKARTDAAPTFS